MKSAVVGVLPPTHGNLDKQPTKPLLIRAKPRWPSPTNSAAAFFLLVTAGALTLTAETELLPRWASFDPHCSPATRDVGASDYRPNDRFYTMMKTTKALAAPTFRGDHEALCADGEADERMFQYCLPITSQDDPTFCAGADRIDLLVRQSPLTLCRASVTHLLLSDVFEGLEAAGMSPSLNFTSTDEARSLAALASAGVSSISFSGSLARRCWASAQGLPSL